MSGIRALVETGLSEWRDRLVNRKQFVLGPRPLDLPGWNNERIGGGFYLSTHPDLNVIRAVEGNRSLTLLGFILDPRYPYADDSTIVKQLLPQLCSDAQPEQSLQCLNVFGGRWILIADNGSHVIIVNDALGLRQVFYTPSLANGDAWCGSQPGIIARLFKLEISRAATDFVNTQEKNGQPEYWLPNDSSAYDDIKLLLPNHYLDLSTAQSRRFWPNAPLPRLVLHRAVKQSAKTLKALMLSAGNRFPLAVLMSSGWDSRVVLAAVKDIKTEVSYFTWNLAIQQTGIEQTPDPDLAVPPRLLSKLGKTRRLLHVPEHMDPDFERIYFQNVSMAHKCWGIVGEALFRSLDPSVVRVAGDGSETVRQQYRPCSRWNTTTPDTLADFARTKQKFAIAEFGKWLRGVPKDMGFDLLDLFYWEQKAGQWLAMGQSEWDIVGESFMPFNCRALLATLLSTDVAYRVGPRYELYRALLKELWPEVLSEPVNPHKDSSTRTSLRGRVKNMLVKSHLIEHARLLSDTTAAWLGASKGD
jgi:hypothetical protein